MRAGMHGIVRLFSHTLYLLYGDLATHWICDTLLVQGDKLILIAASLGHTKVVQILLESDANMPEENKNVMRLIYCNRSVLFRYVYD